MLTIPAEELDRQKMTIRHTVRDGGEVALTFRGRQYGTIVPASQLEAERAELAVLRRRVAELEAASKEAVA
jgi:antitoxin (DNA-binding transcriptional repressor) of toxin-antitoxin stability system